jgi:CheY-like chemotaxis protein
MSTLPATATRATAATIGLVLIVDDTPANLEVVSEALSDAGFDVAIATSGDRALQ